MLSICPLQTGISHKGMAIKPNKVVRVINVMYLKTFRRKIISDRRLWDHQRELMDQLVTLVISQLRNPGIWPWKNMDHRTLLRHYESISVALAAAGSDLDFETARLFLVEYT